MPNQRADQNEYNQYANPLFCGHASPLRGLGCIWPVFRVSTVLHDPPVVNGLAFRLLPQATSHKPQAKYPIGNAITAKTSKGLLS